jgi:hypothetical protein
VTQPSASNPTEAEIWMALHDAMGGNLSISNRRKLISVHREAALREAVQAAEGELLQDNTGTPEDEAYNQGIRDVIAAITRRMAEEGR